MSEDELLLYLCHPGDTIALLKFQHQFGDPNCLPCAVWFEGLKQGEYFSFSDSNGKLHHMSLLRIGALNKEGIVAVDFQLDHELVRYEVQVQENQNTDKGQRKQADPSNPNHVGAVSSGDLWVVHVAKGDVVKKGQELCNISIMKQEKGIFAKRNGVVKHVYIPADFKHTNQMINVKEGDLILELEE